MKFSLNFFLTMVTLACAGLLQSHAQPGKTPLSPLPTAVKPISKKEFLQAGCLSILLFPGDKSHSSMRVASYSMTIDGPGRDRVIISSETDSFPSLSMGFIKSNYTGTKVSFSKIILYSDSSGGSQKMYPPPLAFHLRDD